MRTLVAAVALLLASPAWGSPAAPEPIRQVARLPLAPSYGATLVGTSRKRPVMFALDGDGNLVTIRIDSGEQVASWKATDLAELARSPWQPGHSTQSGKPELDFDLAGRLPAVRRDADALRAIALEAGVQELGELALSADGATTIVKGGDLLFWLRSDQPPVLLDPGASDSAAVAPDGKRVAYRGCGSPCGTYALRVVDLGETPHPRVAKVAEPETIAWAPDGAAILAATKTCVIRVDAKSLAARDVACDAKLEAAEPIREGVVALVRTAAGRELRTYGFDGKLRRTAAFACKVPPIGDRAVTTLALSPHGTALIAVGGPKAAAETWLVDATGASRKLALPVRSNFASAARWVDDDRVLVLAHDTVYLVDAAAVLAAPQ